MKKIALLLSLVLVIGIMFGACSNNLTDKEDIIKVFNKNEETIIEAVKNNSFEQVKKISGIQNVYVGDDYIDFECGGSGMGPSTHYYGFFYSPDDNLTAWNGGACPKDELKENGNGFRWEQKEGDNIYYVEKIGEHFFYYEAHF